MDQIDSQQIDKFLNDISTIKNVLNRNRGPLQKIFTPSQFRLIGYVSGFGIIFLCLLFHFLIQHFRTYGGIPLFLKVIIYVAIALCVILLGFIKWGAILSSVRQTDPKMTMIRVLKELFIFRVRHIYGPIFILYTFFIIFFIYIGKPFYIIPTIIIAFGLWYNFIGSITGMRQYLIGGYWFMITGILSVIFNFVPPLIVLAGSLGLGLLVFAVSISFKTGVDIEE